MAASAPTRQEWTGLLVIVGGAGGQHDRVPHRVVSTAVSVTLSLRASSNALRLMWNSLDGTFDRRWFRTIELAAVVGVATLAFPAGRRAVHVSLPIAAVLLAVAAVQFAFMSSINHVLESRSPRYLMMAVFFWQAACVGFCVVQLAAVLPRVCRASTVAATLAVAMIVAAGIAHGRPGSDVVRAEIDRSLGRFTDDILAARCTHVTGDYWRAWTAMFHVNLRLAEAGSPRRVWAICHRSRATAKYWQTISPGRNADCRNRRRRTAEPAISPALSAPRRSWRPNKSARSACYGQSTTLSRWWREARSDAQPQPSPNRPAIFRPRGDASTGAVRRDAEPPTEGPKMI